METIELYENLIDGLQLIIKNQQEIIKKLLTYNGLYTETSEEEGQKESK